MTNRFRFRNSLATVSGTIIQEVYGQNCTTGAGSWSTNWTGSYSYRVGKYETMGDVIVPGFRKKSALGLVYFNPMHQNTYEVDAGYGTGQDEVTTTSLDCSGSYAYHPKSRRTTQGLTLGRALLGGGPQILSDNTLALPTGVLPADVITDLTAEAATDARNARGRGDSDSNMYEALAELDKSLSMLGSALSSADQFFGSNSKALKRAKGLGSAWLLYHYGIEPVMADVQNAVESVDRAVGRVRRSSRGHASHSQTVTAQSSLNLFGIYTQNYVITMTETYSVRCMFLDEYVATFQSNAGFSFKNLATLPWELLPYSFVVDWFSNVGSFIGSLIPSLDLKELGSCTVVTRNVQRSVASTTSSLSGSYWNVANTNLPPHGHTARWTSKYRLNGVAAPSLVIRNDFRFDSVRRLADAISLIMQRL